jgi:O-antigen/teichoic acid export membrane protein
MTAMRNAFIKVLTVVAILVFVKNKDDLVKYVFIMACGEFIKYASIWISFRKNTKLVKVQIRNIFGHLKPTAVLFIPVIATSVYRSMDKIMLGFMTTMEETGIYENSEKIVYMLLGFVTSLEMVMMPKISNLFENGKIEEAHRNISKSMIFVMALTSSMAFGIIGITPNFVPWFYGSEFMGCIELLPPLVITLVFIGWANVIRTQYIVPKGRDSIYVISTLIGAAINLIVNLMFIPLLGAKGAVIGTIAAELSVAIYLSIIVRKELPILRYLKETIIFPIIGIIMAIIVRIVGIIGAGLRVIVVQIVIGGVVFMILSMFYLKLINNDLYNNIIYLVKNALKKKRLQNGL